jgi:DNA-binding response OmpR family regulator
LEDVGIGEEAAMPSMHRGRKPRLALVVDDEEDIRLLLTELLTNAGYRCVEAGDAHEAFDALDDLGIVGERLDLAVLDILLPGMTGAELGLRLREMYPGLPIVAVTAHLGAWDRDDLADLGFDATVRKPLNFSEFLRACTSAIRSREGTTAVTPRCIVAAPVTPPAGNASRPNGNLARGAQLPNARLAPCKSKGAHDGSGRRHRDGREDDDRLLVHRSRPGCSGQEGGR